MKIQQPASQYLLPHSNSQVHQNALSQTENKNELDEKSTTFRLSQKDREQLSNTDDSEQVKSKKDGLPQHIQKMLEQIERIKEQIKEEEERLVKLKNQTDLNEDTKKDMILQQANYIAQLQMNLLTLVDNVKEAMKDAGITDPGVLISAIA
ncbi:hypothetical protein [Pseudoalteromonas aurantia]|uniref:Orphan protein n=1 Tax=Pseudoalteromonas aurantia 208 TaxID=1314867 RepID=A0ABR9EIG2_9GAMM|nr:hypothetical protein [Pseudoalteromonas aurantia]MBE0370204.1 hypothetical protein [Pseudoalteromonas aurantia 208]